MSCQILFHCLAVKYSLGLLNGTLQDHLFCQFSQWNLSRYRWWRFVVVFVFNFAEALDTNDVEPLQHELQSVSFDLDVWARFCPQILCVCIWWNLADHTWELLQCVEKICKNIKHISLLVTAHVHVILSPRRLQHSEILMQIILENCYNVWKRYVKIWCGINVHIRDLLVIYYKILWLSSKLYQ